MISIMISLILIFNININALMIVNMLIFITYHEWLPYLMILTYLIGGLNPSEKYESQLG